jgi:hypothetical protein
MDLSTLKPPSPKKPPPVKIKQTPKTDKKRKRDTRDLQTPDVSAKIPVVTNALSSANSTESSIEELETFSKKKEIEKLRTSGNYKNYKYVYSNFYTTFKSN